MKLYKYFALGLATLSLTACHDDNSINDVKGVTVEMQNDEMRFAEDYAGSYYYIPFQLDGPAANGPVKVTFQIGVIDENPDETYAVQGVNFFLTSTEYTIPEGQTEGVLEFYPTGDNIENANRQFTVTIIKAEGAQIGAQATTVVTLVDNESLLPDAYEKIQGTWTLTAVDEDPTLLTIIGAEKGEEGYLTDLTITGWAGYDWVETQVGFGFDAATMQAKVAFNFGGWCAKEVQFTNLGLMDVMFAGVAGNSLVSSGSVNGTTNEEITEINFPSDAAFVGALFDSATGSFTGKVWFWYEGMQMKKNL